MKTLKTLLLTLIFAGISLSSFAGGPWVLKKNTAFIQVQGFVPAYRYSSMLTGRFISSTQGVNRRTFNSDFGLYAEYGISDKFDVIARVPFKYVSTGDRTDETYFTEVLPAGNLFGMSNVELDLKYGLVDKKVKVAVSLNTSWNTISQDLDKGLATGFDANSFGLTAHVGRSKAKSYGFLELGYQKYTNNFSDVLEIQIEHGWKLGDHLNLAMNLSARHSLKNGTYFNANLAQTGLYPNNQEAAAISAKLSYETTSGWGLGMAVPLIPIKSNYIGFNGAVALGIYRKFN